MAGKNVTSVIVRTKLHEDSISLHFFLKVSAQKTTQARTQRRPIQHSTRIKPQKHNLPEIMFLFSTVLALVAANVLVSTVVVVPKEKKMRGINKGQELKVKPSTNWYSVCEL